MRTNESAEIKGKCCHGKEISPRMSKYRGIWHMVRERMIKHNRKRSHDEKSMILTWQIPGDNEGPIQLQLERITHHHMARWWCNVAQWWHDQPVTMELVLLWYKTRRCVSLVIQSLLLSTTQQTSNKPFTSSPNHANDEQPHFPVLQWTKHHYQAFSKEVWRWLPVRTTGMLKQIWSSFDEDWSAST